MRYIRNLSFEENPNYGYMYKELETAARKNGFILDNNLDWVKKKTIIYNRHSDGVKNSTGNEELKLEIKPKSLVNVSRETQLNSNL